MPPLDFGLRLAFVLVKPTVRSAIASILIFMVVLSLRGFDGRCDYSRTV